MKTFFFHSFSEFDNKKRLMNFFNVSVHTPTKNFASL